MNIENKIYTIRGLKVMMDSDLAELYGVELKALNQSVRRNISRFPTDFLFECDFDELADLRSQIVTANPLRRWNHMRRGAVYCFTEPGVAMLSSVLKSEQAITVNISIMRTFIKMRSFLAMDDRDEKINKLFQVVFERLDQIEDELYPKLSPNRRKIGLKNK